MAPTDGDGGTAPAGALRGAVARSLVAEFTTVRDGRPATVPLTPLYDDDRGVVVATAPAAFARKADRAAANPKVGMLLHGDDGPAHLAGTATVRDDDLGANAARIERLIEDAPPSRKRDVLLEQAESMRTRLGLLLFDWYGLRILIEIEPDSIRPVDAPGRPGVGAWPGANIDDAEAASYDRAVVTVVDDDGWPRTWILEPTAFGGGTARVSPPADVSLVDGQPACVLCHGFGPDLRDVAHRLVRGRVRERSDGLGIDPASSFRFRNETALDLVRFVLNGKRRTRRYLRERGENYRGLPDLATLLRPDDGPDAG